MAYFIIMSRVKGIINVLNNINIILFNVEIGEVFNEYNNCDFDTKFVNRCA